jgi:hypothetical protein
VFSFKDSYENYCCPDPEDLPAVMPRAPPAEVPVILPEPLPRACCVVQPEPAVFVCEPVISDWCDDNAYPEPTE